MPPRHAYWTIIVDDQPTSFRAHDVEDLLPTFNRLREKHPSAILKWFERGRLWESRDAARQQGFGQGERRWEGARPDRPPGRAARDERPHEPPRDRKWRPGGEHRDPRQKYKDAKKAKWDRVKKNIRRRWEERQRPPGGQIPPPEPNRGEHTPPHGDPMRAKVARPERWGRDERDRGGWKPKGGLVEPKPVYGGRAGEGGRRDDRRGGWKPKPPGRWRDERDRPRWKPKGKPRGEWRGDERDRDGWKPKPPGGWRAKRDRPKWKPKGKPWGGKPAGGGFRGRPKPGPARRSSELTKRAKAGPKKPRGDDE